MAKKRPPKWQTQDWKIPKDAEIVVDRIGRIGFIAPAGHSIYKTEQFAHPEIGMRYESLQDAGGLRPATEAERALFKSLVRRGRKIRVAWFKEQDRKQEEKQRLAIEQHARILDLVGLELGDFHHSGVRHSGIRYDKNTRRGWGWYIFVETNEGYEGFSPEAVKTSHGCFITRNCHDGDALYYFKIPAGRIPDAKKLQKELER